jgi:hypothetical protein
MKQTVKLISFFFKLRQSEIPVFNVTCNPKSKLPWKFVLGEGRKLADKFPFEIGKAQKLISFKKNYLI